MVVSTKAIVISKIKYNDNDLIVKCYTASSGVKSYIIKNASKSKKGKLKPSKFHRYPKFKIPFETLLVGFLGLYSREVIQQPFSPLAKLDCPQMLNGKGLIPTTTFVLLNFLPIPILPVTRVGSAIPTSYSKIRSFSFMYVLPQRTDVPGKTKSSSSKKAIPKFHSINDSLDRSLVNSCARERLVQFKQL